MAEDDDIDAERILLQFSYFDQNGDGKIDRGELLTALQNVDETTWTEERVDAVLVAADLDKDSRIQYNEFVAFVEKDSELAALFRKATSKIPVDSIDGMVRQLSTMSAEQGKPDLATALDGLREVPWEQKEPAVSLLLTLLKNIVKDPTNPKFRRIKTTNKTLAAKVFSVTGCAAFLIAAGFEEQGEELVLPEGVDVAWVVDELTCFGNKALMDQKRAERDAKIAAAKAADAHAKHLKSAHLPSGGSNDEERRAILEKAEYDRQERVAREKLAAEGYREENHVPAEKGGGDVKRFSDIGVDVNRGGG